ncbi:MAG TPA: hypothetical protein VMY06_11550, partial [Sedimentisphaerales bacterium]|nr:hypothetical protein [Sedimentisphaerales bacterium]
ADYYISPGTIQIDTSTTPPTIDYATPVAEYDDLQSDTLLGLDSNGITIEMGSLYAATDPCHPTAPVKSGVLLSIYVSRPPEPDLQTCLTITGNVARAGSSGVVMEDPDEVVAVTATGCCVVFPSLECYVGQPDYAVWEAVGKPLSWCYPRQCHGDATGTEDGDPKLGYFWVQEGDLNALITGWKKDGPLLDDYVPGQDWIAADFNHTEDGDPKLGYYRVQEGDLNVLITYWKKDAMAQGDDPAVPADCLDLP